MEQLSRLPAATPLSVQGSVRGWSCRR